MSALTPGPTPLHPRSRVQLLGESLVVWKDPKDGGWKAFADRRVEMAIQLFSACVCDCGPGRGRATGWNLAVVAPQSYNIENATR